MTSVPVERRVGRYEIVREVGRGATAVVYLARQTDLDRDVALKELASFHAADPAATARFLRESRLAGSLNHPNIVTVHEYFEHAGVPFIAMEYFERGSLRPLLPTLTTPQAVGVLEGVLAGLVQAHARGVVHRDLKPENVMVTAGGTVKIADFGIAKALASGSGNALTLSGTTVGTPAYMAPEQALATSVGPRADLYAVGVLAYELLSGAVPFQGSNVAMAVMLQHLNEPAPSLHAAAPHVDAALCAWVERLLAKAPEDRPQTAGEAWDELDEITVRTLGPRWRRESRLTDSEAPISAAASLDRTVATQRLEPEQPTTRSRRAIRFSVASVAAVVLGLAATFAAFALSDDPQDSVQPRETGRTGTSKAAPTPKPPPRTLARGVDLSTGGDPATATLRLTGPPLAAGALLVRDAEISDGHAWFEIRRDGIGTRSRGSANDALAVRIRQGADRLRIDLRAVEGEFASFRVVRADGRTVVVTLVRPRPQPPTETVPRSPTDTTTTEAPTETQPTEPEDDLKTG